MKSVKIFFLQNFYNSCLFICRKHTKMKIHLLSVFLFLLCCIFRANAQNADLRLLQYINGPISGADQTWRAVTNSVGYIAPIAPASMFIIGLANHDKELQIKALETAGSIVIAEGLSLGIKRLSNRERPGAAHPDLIIPKISESNSSFPSGHTSLAFSTATSLSLSFPKWYVIAPAFTYAAAVGYSRMYLGVHYPTDVIGGAILGTGSAYLTWKLQKLLNKKYHYHQ